MDTACLTHHYHQHIGRKNQTELLLRSLQKSFSMNKPIDMVDASLLPQFFVMPASLIAFEMCVKLLVISQSVHYDVVDCILYFTITIYNRGIFLGQIFRL